MHGFIFTRLRRLSFIFSTRFTSFVSYLFSLYQSPSSSLSMVFDIISSKIDQVLLINPFVNVFVFGDFNIHL